MPGGRIMKRYKRLVKEYQGRIISGADPIKIFKCWLADAERAGNPEANAFVLSSGDISSRVVLLKMIRGRTLTFFSNYASRKGRELQIKSNVALNFYWGELHRQVRIVGQVERSPVEISDQYFASRPRAAQVAAYSSPQSKEISSRAALLKLFRQTELQFKDRPIPRPKNWGGYDIVVRSIEFWQGMPNRLHDRLVFTAVTPRLWKKQRLAP